MSLELMAANLDLQGRADRVAHQEPETLRAQAVRAARDRDETELWMITEAFMVLRGGRGARVSHGTLEQYRTGLKVFLEWSGGAGVSLLRPGANMGFRYARYLEGLGLAPSTVRVRLAAARALYAALRWTLATEYAPFTDVKAAHDPVPRWEKRKPYPPEDVARLLAVAGPQEAVIVVLGAHAGLRATEMTTVLRKDIHLDEREPYLVVTGKGQKRQEVALSRTATHVLRRWLDATPGYGPHLLSLRTKRSVENTLQKACAAAGVRYGGREVHGLRHHAGTEIYVQTSDILAVRDQLRHRTVDSSEIYVNYARAGKKKAVSDW
ncbi:site-specific integrase [Deinococcus cavernae]|uniref:Site-specific integrase n=1 Tax=Deinococcus cavernae TaxID=2320857 RepID=A0A418VE97_9DEIO|nr:site-specific integrase [Deinococcus cavernae]RJF74426.1 site-specific integrase [Deinococcus cavernae]